MYVCMYVYVCACVCGVCVYVCVYFVMNLDFSHTLDNMTLGNVTITLNDKGM